ncbi:MAG: hypothetical protein AB8G26_13270 [Ilumatobacter sp.]
MALGAIGATLLAAVAVLSVGVGPSATAGADDQRVTLAYLAGSTPIPGPDIIVVDRLRASGYHVVTVDDDDTADAIDGVDAVVISSSVDPSIVTDTPAGWALPVLTWEGYLHDDLGLATRGGETSKLRRLVVFEGDHPLAGGLTGRQLMTSSAHRLSFGLVGPGARVAATEQNTGRPVIFAYERGAELADGSPAAGRRVGFHFDYDAPRTATTAAWEAFDRAVAWAVDGLGGGASTTTTSTTSSSTTTTTTTTTIPGPAGSKVGFIGGKVRPDGLPVEDSDRLIFDHFGRLGFDFTFLDDDLFLDPDWNAADELAAFDLLMLSSGVEVHKVGDGLRHIGVPLVTWEGYLHDENGLASRGGEFASSPSIRVLGGTPFSNGLSGGVGVHTRAERLSYGIVGADAIVGANVPGKSRFAVIFGYRSGDQLVDGGTAPAARVGFFLDWQSVRTATPATWALFEAAVDFARS